jgi:hypothetical protein
VEASTAASNGEVSQAGTENTGSPGPVEYEYIGTTSITVRGAVTGNIYRFRGNGNRITVDIRDVPAINSVPNLRRV